MVIIGHAVSDENGGIDGAFGDQTGKEIATQEWRKRSGGWDVYLQPLDLEAADKAASFVEQVCADDSFGYSQPDRWSGYKSIIANAGKIAGARGNFDCSSLVFAAYLMAGLGVNMGYTGNLEEYFMDTGKFKAYRDSAYLESGSMSQRGGVYLTAGKHVAMVLSNSEEAMPDGEEEPGEEVTPIPSVDPPYVEIVIHGQHGVRVRQSPETGKKMFNAMFGDKLPYIDTDPVTGWHSVATDDGLGWITYKPKYVRLVMQ